MRFEKWQALGNDYVIVEERELPFELTPERVRRMCEPHTGIGSDGVLLLSPTDGRDAVARLRIFNPDGSEAELSGNGAREAAMYLRHGGWTDRDEFTIDTASGEIRPRVTGPDTCAMAIGRARLTSKDFPSGAGDGRGRLEAAGRELEFQHVSVGNPQCAIEAPEGLEGLDLGELGPPIEHHELFPNRTNVSFWRRDSDHEITDDEELEALDLEALGPAVEGHELFPNRTNVSFWRRTGPGEIRARIFERGVGETLSSGTGASGAAFAAVLGGAEPPVTVRLDGGELEVDVAENLEIELTGWAVPVYQGELTPELVEHLEAVAA
ncbi:MAG: diaminopimelate epimerase [Thermoleophilaceae bacterium]